VGNAGKLSFMDLNELSAISSLQQAPIELDKPHILAYAAETVFLQFKEQVLFKLKNKISAVQCRRKTFRLIPLLIPVDSCRTIPLRDSLARY
jgi:hypothetical protein